MSIIIRKIKKKEEKKAQELILSILKNEFSEDATAYPQNDLKNIQDSYGKKREIFLVAEKEDLIIGTSAIKEDDKETALLRRIFVHPEFRNKGYGLTLLEEAIDFAKKQRFKRIIFNGTSKMISALNLCKKKGFIEKERIDLGGVTIYRYCLSF